MKLLQRLTISLLIMALPKYPANSFLFNLLK